MKVLSVALIIFAYLFGSINFAILITRIKYRADIRELGDHNPGAANIFRSVSKKVGIVVGILDGLKGFLPLIIAKWVGAPSAVLLFVSAAAILGHDYPIFYRFKGGSGLSTTMGCALFFAPIETILIFLFIIPLGYFLTLMKKKRKVRIYPGGIVVSLFYTYFIVLVFLPNISNEIKIFSIIAISIVILKKSNTALHFLAKFFIKGNEGS